ncbi:OmpA family protein [Loktanella sp. D2R18]|uniref:OmpA family protein n=1 Tax=Rhodobacterales TaxID=204455 RepID=UPI000DE8DAB2|nr:MULTISPECIES: OmpA family protein [Rhodobacterales]MDO6590105.1 OmpA family protein [Yoonia sp. 1_MG-2023]RBW45774.1 OmpA family protein [Loktanella sp. D2R18]
MKKLMTTAMAAALLAGCSATTDDFPQLQYEAGAVVDGGGFGNATMNNVMVQSAQEDYRVNLARRFASEIDSTVTFEFNSTVLDADAQRILSRQADWIRQFPEVRFRVYGHTDLVGSQSYNRSLGLRRAQAVVAYLTSQGIGRDRLEAVASFGETQPLIATNDRERRNRRTVTEVSGFVETDPLVLDGKYAQVIYRSYIERAVPATALEGTTIASE